MSATMTRAAKGFQVTCPFCHDADEPIELNLRDLGECRCPACDETFSPRQALEKAQELARQWAAVVGGIELAAEALERSE